MNANLTNRKKQSSHYNEINIFSTFYWKNSNKSSFKIYILVLSSAASATHALCI